MSLVVTYPDFSVVHSLVSDYGGLVAPNSLALHCYRDAILEHSDEVETKYIARMLSGLSSFLWVTKAMFLLCFFLFSPVEKENEVACHTLIATLAALFVLFHVTDIPIRQFKWRPGAPYCDPNVPEHFRSMIV
jgi:DMSO/TMAO reductase YedYZ heme-binding membrane subunit